MKNTEEFIYTGIPSFMGAPFISLKEAHKYDVAAIGVPVDFGASYRLGAKYAPRRIREYSFWDRVDGTIYYDLDINKVRKSNKLKIADLGDINIWPGNAKRNDDEIIQVISAIRKKTFPLVLGGDHSITYSSFIGCQKGLRHRDANSIGLLHFDAHLDTEDKYLTMPEIWHGNPFRELIKRKYLKGEHMVTIGPRDVVDHRWYEFVKENGITLFTSREVRLKGIISVMKEVIELLKSRCSYVYVTFDIDSIDISQAPGTGTPSGGGLFAEDIIIAMRMLRTLPIVGFDLVELNPKYDVSGATSVLACSILWNFLAFGFNPKL